MSDKLKREYCAMMSREGLEGVKVRVLRGAHLELSGTWQGRQYRGVAPHTPSDPRTMMNTRADVRRWLRTHKT